MPPAIEITPTNERIDMILGISHGIVYCTGGNGIVHDDCDIGSAPLEKTSIIINASEKTSKPPIMKIEYNFISDLPPPSFSGMFRFSYRGATANDQTTAA